MQELMSPVRESRGQNKLSCVGIIGTGRALPQAVVPSEHFDKLLGRSAGWLERKSQVASRTIASDTEGQEEMAAIAAQNALDNAGLTADDIDLILFGAAVGRQPIPATAPLVKKLLGMTSSPVPAYDVNATCLSALVAMDMAALQISAGRIRTALVVASEISSRALPWQDEPATAALFGDGAGAVILQACGGGDGPLKFRHFAMETFCEGYDYCTLASGGTRFDFHNDPAVFSKNAYFRMNGHELFRLTRKRLPDFIEKLVSDTGWAMDEIDLVIPHQASPLALEHMIRRCGFHPDRIVNTVRQTGNLVAASLPITLHLARIEGRIKPGAKVLMVGTSAGVSIAGATLEA